MVAVSGGVVSVDVAVDAILQRMPKFEEGHDVRMPRIVDDFLYVLEDERELNLGCK